MQRYPIVIYWLTIGGASVPMTRYLLAGLMLGTAAMAATTSSTVTYNKDVLPIMQKNCQSCHRPGEIGPSSFLTYQSTRPWAKAIREAVLTKKMPPWFADPRFGHFANDRRLNESDIKTLVAWVDAGAKAIRKTCRLPSNGATDGTSNRTS
jgi:mono/diheme cytochrome c family protein